MRCDIVIFGGGVTGLWMLDELRRAGFSALLLENRALGSGQTVASQGIIHGGLKYTLSGMLTRSAENISAMPQLWRDCFVGDSEPNLSQTVLRSQFCYLWRSQSLSSRLGMIGAKVGLQVSPQTLSDADVPPILEGCPGTIAKLEEQVMSPPSLIANLLERNRDYVLKYDSESGFGLSCLSMGTVDSIKLTSPNGSQLHLQPKYVVFAAGRGNAPLLDGVGLSMSLMQLRPLHMVLVRGELPEFNGHCVDGAKTRVTITTDRDAQGRTIWQIGGQVSEIGVGLEPSELIAHAQEELTEVLPALRQESLEWGTYRVDRAEQETGGKRPDSFALMQQGNTFTVWPTKLVLAPVVTQSLLKSVYAEFPLDAEDLDQLSAWEKPAVALPPWEIDENWVNHPLRKAA